MENLASTLSLAALGIFFVVILFHFLLGALRGFRKSLVYFIGFVIMIILFVIITNPIVDAIYKGNIFDTFKSSIPLGDYDFSNTHSLQGAVSLIINGTVEGNTTVEAEMIITGNAELMSIIDGTVMMVLRIVVVMLLFTTGYFFWTIITWIVWMAAFRGNAEERKKRKKFRLYGGLLGAVKGFVYALIILMPIACMTNLINELDTDVTSMIPTSNSEIVAEQDEIINTVFDFSEQFQQKVGWAYRIIPGREESLDEMLLDAVTKISAEGEDPIYIRQEVYTLINIADEVYATFDLANFDPETEIDPAIFLDADPEGVARVFTLLSQSRILTRGLAAGTEFAIQELNNMSGEEGQIIIDVEKFDTTGIDSLWWANEIDNLGNIYTSLMGIGLDVEALTNDNLSGGIENVTEEGFVTFIDALFASDLLNRVVYASLEFGLEKINEDEVLIENIDEIINHYELTEESNPVRDEIANIAALITIFQDSNVFVGNDFVIENLTVGDIEKVIDEDLIENSYIINKVLNIALVKGIEELNNDPEMELGEFDFDPNQAGFSWQNEIGALIEIASIVVGGSDKTINEIQIMFEADPTTVIGVPHINQIVNDTDHKIWSNTEGWSAYFIPAMLDYMLVPQLEKVLEEQEIIVDVNVTNWQAEFQSIAALLTIMVGEEAMISDIEGIASSGLEGFNVGTIKDITDSNTIWQSVLLNDLLGAVLEKQLMEMDPPIFEQTDIDGITSWRAELRSIVEVLTIMLGETATLDNLEGIETSLTVGKLHDVALDTNNLIWSASLIPALMDYAVTEGLSSLIDPEDVPTITSWQTEVLAMVNFLLVVADGDVNFVITDLASEFEGTSRIKLSIIEGAVDAVDEETGSQIVYAVLNNKLPEALTSAGITVVDLDVRSEMQVVYDISAVIAEPDPITSIMYVDFTSISSLETGAIDFALIEIIASDIEDSNLLQTVMGDAVEGISPSIDTSTWSDQDWGFEMNVLKNVLDTIKVEDTPGHYVITIADVGETSGLKFGTINVLVAQTYPTGTPNTLSNIQNSSVLQGVIGTALDGATEPDFTLTWTDTVWHNELLALRNILDMVLFDGEATDDDAIDFDGLDMTGAISLGTLEVVRDEIDDSTFIQYQMAPTFADLLEEATLPSGFNWHNEMTGLVGIVSELATLKVGAVMPYTSADYEININSMSFDGIKLSVFNALTLDDPTLLTPHIELSSVLRYQMAGTFMDLVGIVPDGAEYTKVQKDAFISLEVTNEFKWTDEIDALNNVLVAHLCDGVYDPDYSIDMTTLAFGAGLNVLTLETIRDEINQSSIMRNQISPTFASLLEEATLPSGFAWYAEMYGIVEVVSELATLRAGHDGSNGSVDYEVNLTSMSFTSVKMSLLESLITMSYDMVNVNIELSTILRYQMADVFMDLVGIIPDGAEYTKAQKDAFILLTANPFIWELELVSLVDVIESKASGTPPAIDLSTMDFTSIKIGLLDKLIAVQVGQTSANIELSTILQHQLKTPIESLANGVNNDPTDVYTLGSGGSGSVDNTASSEYWTIELTALIAIIKHENGSDPETEIDITTMATSTANFDTDFIGVIALNIFEATALQHIMKPIVRSLESLTYQMTKDELQWDNDDWDREMNCISHISIASDSTLLTADANYVYGLAGSKEFDEIRYYTAFSYLLQSVISDVLNVVGVDTYNVDLINDSSAYTWDDIYLVGIGTYDEITGDLITPGIIDSTTTNANEAWQVMLDKVFNILEDINTVRGNPALFTTTFGTFATPGTIQYDIEMGMIGSVSGGSAYLTSQSHPTGTMWDGITI